MKRRTWFTGSSLGLAVTLVVLLGISGAVPPNTPGPQTLWIDNSARSSTANVQIVGLYGAVGSSNTLLVNDHDQGYNANAQMPITSTSGTMTDVITGAYQTILPSNNIHDINIPRPSSSQFTTGSTTQTASLMDYTGVLNQVSLVNTRASVTPIVVNGNLTLNADGSISITNASGTVVYNAQNLSSSPLGQVLSWDGSRFHLDLNSTDTIIVNGYNVSGSTAAESRGLDIRADLIYEGVGAFVVNVATGMEQRGIQFEGQAKNGSGVGTGSPVSVLAGQEGDGLAFITNGRLYLNQEASFVPTVQGFLYAQGYRDGNGQPKGIDIVGGNLQGMAVGSRVYIRSMDGSSGIVTDRIMINGAQSTMTIPSQFPGGRPVYTAAVSNWREAR